MMLIGGIKCTLLDAWTFSFDLIFSCFAVLRIHFNIEGTIDIDNWFLRPCMDCKVMLEYSV